MKQLNEDPEWIHFEKWALGEGYMAHDAVSKRAAWRGWQARSALLALWNPINTAPRDGTSVLVPPDSGYTQAFWQDGYWWWHTGEPDFEVGPAAGPEPTGWLPMSTQTG